MRVCFSSHRDVALNLAIEDELLDRADSDERPLLMFCVNDPAVVLGRNQNPWQETRPGALRREGIALARRITGGGTVYHDAGNLNYALILPRTVYHRDRVFKGVLGGLRRYGIAAERSGSHSLMAGGRKFSGHAFCFRRGYALHHGTLLLNSDLARLEQAIQPLTNRVTSKAVASIRSRVVNLTELRPDLRVADLQAALVEGLAAEFGWQPPHGTPEKLSRMPDARRLAQHRTVGWVYTDCPAFTMVLGGGNAGVRVERGHVASVDAAVPGHDRMAGVAWEPASIRSVLSAAGPDVQAFWERELAELF